MNSKVYIESSMKRFLAKKIILWLFLCFIISYLFFGSLWSDFGLLSWSYLKSQGAYPGIMLLLCAFWLYIKRNEVKYGMTSEKLISRPKFIFLGVIALITSILLPKEVELPVLVFELLLAYIGLFIVFFGSGAMIPSILLGIYGFTVEFPVLLTKYFDAYYSSASIWVVINILKTFGFKIIHQGQLITFFDINGDKINIIADYAISGSVSTTIFIALFALMMLDIKLPNKNALYMLIFGFVGTIVMNLIKLMILFITGYFYGFDALLKANSYSGYTLLPIWYFIFIYIYITYAKRKIG